MLHHVYILLLFAMMYGVNSHATWFTLALPGEEARNGKCIALCYVGMWNSLTWFSGHEIYIPDSTAEPMQEWC